MGVVESKERILRIELVDPQDYLVFREGSGGTVEILDVAVGSERRKGKGRQLVSKLFTLVDHGTRVWAITRTSNEVAQQWYEALGFRVVGILRRFYGDDDGADAVMYGRKSNKEGKL